jgi:two-component system response regulator RegA
MRGRVLLLDDDDSARITFAALLEDDGFGVVEASSIAEGRAALLAGPFDVALIDVHLEGELGADFAPDVLAANPHAAVAFVSGDPPPSVSPLVWIMKGSDTNAALALVAKLASEAITRAGAKS